MGNHNVTTIPGSTIVADTRDNRIWFDGLLRRRDLKVWLPDVIATAPFDESDVTIGHEGERAILKRINDTFIPAFDEGPRILAAVSERCRHLPGKVMGELVKCLAEVVSAQYSLANGGFGALRADMVSWQSALLYEAVRRNCVVGAFGTVPWDASWFQGDTLQAMIDVIRYRTYRARMEGWTFNLLDGTEFGQPLGFADIVGIGPLTAHQVSVDIPANRLHDFVNAANVAVAPARCIFPNGDTPWNVEVIPHDMRIEAFRQATIVNGVDRTFIGPYWFKDPYDVFAGTVNQVGGRSIFLDADESVAGSALQQLLSSIFPMVRVRFGKREVNGETKITIYLEIRPLSGGPTVAHEVAASAFVIGLMYHIASDIANWTKHGFNHIEANFWRSGSSDGLNTRLFWQVDGHAYSDSALNIATDMMPLIRTALIEQCHAREDDVDQALEPAWCVLKNQVTPTVWGKQVRAELRNRGRSPAEAMAEWTQLYLNATQHGTASALMGNLRVPALV